MRICTFKKQKQKQHRKEMFSHSKNAKPLKAVHMKYMNLGENDDIANTIYSVEMSYNKTPTIKRKKPARAGKRRRSASIEKIFNKQKVEEEKARKTVLQQQLEDLKKKENILKCRTPGVVIPPPPPPPPMAGKPVPIKAQTDKPSKNVDACQVPTIKIDLTAIQSIRNKLRKVDAKQEKPEVASDEDNGSFISVLQKRINTMRSQIKESSSDDDSSEEYNNDEEF